MLAIVVLVPWTTRSSKKEAIAAVINNRLSKSSPCLRDRLSLQQGTRFTKAQLQELEYVFQETHYPSWLARKDPVRWTCVPEADVQDWFRTRRTIFRRSRMLILCHLPSGSDNNDTCGFWSSS